MKKSFLITIVVIVIVAAGAFVGGTYYGKITLRKALTGASGNPLFLGLNNAPRSGTASGNFAGRSAIGQILSNDGKTMTISLQAGGSKIILLSGTTQVSKTIDGTAADLAVGADVVVTGTTNEDGSISADSIQIRPAGAPAGIPARNGNTPTAPLQR